MNKISGKLTVFFDDPFWVGVAERYYEGKLEVAKITFGAEPKDYKIYEWVLKNWYGLRFSPAVEAEQSVDKPISPKRIQRKIHDTLSNTGVGTKAQQALKLQQEQLKLERKIFSHKKNEEEKKHQFELKQNKKRQKHKGR